MRHVITHKLFLVGCCQVAIRQQYYFFMYNRLIIIPIYPEEWLKGDNFQLNTNSIWC